VLATPPAEGFNWLIYLLPPAAIIIAAVFLGKNFAKWNLHPAKKRAKKTTASDKYSRLLEKQLKDRR
jgi:cytochrome c-type biogenesis protein CcmH/NrfF